MNKIGEQITAVLTAVIGVAILAVIVSKNAQTAGVLSGRITHQESGYWHCTIDSTRAMALLWQTDLTLGVRVIGAVANIGPGPIGCTASAVTNGNPATIVTSGSCAGFTGLTAGVQYYYNGDGTVTSANTGHPAGVAIDSATLLVAP